MIYSNVRPVDVVDAVEGLEGYRKDKYPLMEGMENKEDTEEEEEEEVEVKEPEAVDPEMFCFGSFCSQKKVEGFSSRDTIKSALKNLF